MRYIILDTSSLIRMDFERLKSLSETGKIVVPNSVIDELKKEESILSFLSFLDFFDKLSPRGKSVNEVKRRISNIVKNLSDTDLEVIALAFELKNKNYDVIVYTEDFDIQNALGFLGIKVEGLRNKIRRVYRYLKKCKNCGYTFSMKYEECPNCGSNDFIVIKRRIKNAN